jgi:hypothetical protein
MLLFLAVKTVRKQNAQKNINLHHPKGHTPISKIYWQMALHATYCSPSFCLLPISMSMLSQKKLRPSRNTMGISICLLRYEVGGQFGTVLEHPIISYADVI